MITLLSSSSSMSESRDLSWTSSTITWVIPSSFGSEISLLSKIPIVQYVIRVLALVLLSSRTLYPITSPTFSPLSKATRSARPIADIRRGCVQMMEQYPALSAAISFSRTN